MLCHTGLHRVFPFHYSLLLGNGNTGLLQPHNNGWLTSKSYNFLHEPKKGTLGRVGMSHSVVRIVSPTIYAPLSLFSLWSLWLLLSFPHFIFTGIDSNLITSTHVHTQSLEETLFQDSITALKWIFFQQFFFHRWRSFLPKRTQLRRQKRKKNYIYKGL